jgi:phospholipid/cholesterol/gamma-HCH transport system substrate-binding protein
MFKGNNNLVVGLFVSIAIAVFVGFILWLTGRSGTEEMERYSVLFEKDVSGLAVGGPVKYMGVNIGSVIQMEIVRHGGILIRVDIEVLKSTPVDSDTYASLAFQGITGVAVVNLDSDEEGPHGPLKPAKDTPYPLIPVRQIGIAAVLSGAPRIVERLDDLLVQANELLGEDNLASISRSLNNVEALTASLADSKDTIANLPAGLDQTLAEIRAVVGELKGMVEVVQPDVQSAMAGLQSSTASLANLTSQLDDWMTRNEANLERFVQDGLGEAPALIDSASQTMRDLEKLLATLQEDPSQLIHRPQQDSLEIEP